MITLTTNEGMANSVPSSTNCLYKKNIVGAGRGGGGSLNTPLQNSDLLVYLT